MLNWTKIKSHQKLKKPSTFATAHVKANEQLKMKRLDTPTFTGKIHVYPSFKDDFKDHVVVVYGEDSFALKGCQSGDALSTVKCVNNNYDEIFCRLDLKYGRL